MPAKVFPKPKTARTIRRLSRLAGPLWEVPLKDWAAWLKAQKGR